MHFVEFSKYLGSVGMLTWKKPGSIIIKVAVNWEIKRCPGAGNTHVAQFASIA